MGPFRAGQLDVLVATIVIEEDPSLAGHSVQGEELRLLVEPEEAWPPLRELTKRRAQVWP